MPSSSARSMITNESGSVVSGPKFIVPRQSSLTRSAVRPSRFSSMVSPLLGVRWSVRGAAAGRGREVGRFVAVVGSVEGPSRCDDLVDAVEGGGVERDVGRAQQIDELLLGLGADDR